MAGRKETKPKEDYGSFYFWTQLISRHRVSAIFARGKEGRGLGLRGQSSGKLLGLRRTGVGSVVVEKGGKASRVLRVARVFCCLSVALSLFFFFFFSIFQFFNFCWLVPGWVIFWNEGKEEEEEEEEEGRGRKRMNKTNGVVGRGGGWTVCVWHGNRAIDR